MTGITVVSLEQAVAAPFATRQLADLGARVIKIERPDVGDFARGYDQTVNGQSALFRLAQSLERKPDARREARARRGDSQAPDRETPTCSSRTSRPAPPAGWVSMRRRCSREHPRLIVCDVSGYGDSGPYAHKKAYDLLVQSEAGVVVGHGHAERRQTKVGISIADIGAGMYAYSGILTALYQRETTGEGTRVDVTMFEALAEWMAQPLNYTHFGGKPPPRSGPDHATIVPYGPLQVRRRRLRDARHPERARVGEVLRRRARHARSSRLMTRTTTIRSARRVAPKSLR